MIVEWYGGSVFNFIKIAKCFPKWLNYFHYHQHIMRVPVDLQPCQHLFSVFWNIISQKYQYKLILSLYICVYTWIDAEQLQMCICMGQYSQMYVHTHHINTHICVCMCVYACVSTYINILYTVLFTERAQKQW